MPQNPDFSPARSWAIRGLIFAAVLGVLVLAIGRRGGAASAAVKGEAAASPRAAKATRPMARSARPRAGVAGKVVDPEGKPVSGAAVCAFVREERGLTTAEVKAPRCGRTDREGAYEVEDLFPATPLAVSAAAPGFKPTSFRGADGGVEIRLGDGERRGGVDIALRGGGVALKGSVSDATGGAVAGAVVATDGDEPTVGESDAKGAFTLWVEPGKQRVQAVAAGYAPGWAYGPAPGHFFKIELVPGATLVGRAVIAGEGTPVAGAMIKGVTMEGIGESPIARTDEEGRFRLEGLPPGRYRVEATAEGREGYSRSSVTLGLGETSAEIVIELDPAYVVRGQVVDRATQKPCAGGGTVRLFDHGQDEYAEASLEPDGTARMASVIPGSYRVEVQCKGHVTRDDYPFVVVADRDLPPLKWEVDRGAVVRVEVRDGQGEPVTTANVFASGEGPDASYVNAQRAETDGVFLLAGLKPGKYQISVDRDGERGDQQVTAAADHDEQIRIALPAAGAIDGIVEDEGHRPVPNVRVVVLGGSYGSDVSLDDGTFTMRGLSSGEYQVHADGRPVAKVTVTAPGHARVTVTVAGRASVVAGRVIDGAGRPVTDAFVECVPSEGGGRNGPRAPVLTDNDGHFTVEGLGEGAYDVRGYRQGGTEATVEKVQAGARDVVIKLADGASVAGTVTARGAPVERFDLSARGGRFARAEFFFHTGGAFSLRDLPPGTYTLQADTPQGNASVEITLADGEQKSGVTLALAVRGSLDGRLVELESGAPVAGARLDVDGSSPFAVMNNDGHGNTSGSDGRFHLEGVLPGTWSLAVWPADPDAILPAHVTVVVPEGGPGDAGTVRLARSRLGPGEARGNVGAYLTYDGALRAFGPAAQAGLREGDDIVTVDGYDVGGNNRYLFSPLTTVAAGRTLTFGLASGRAVRVTAE